MELLAFFVVPVFTVALCNNVAISPFTKDVLCDILDRINKGCSQEADTTRGKLTILECVAICLPDELCVGASVDDQGKCFIHHRCPQLPDCTSEDFNHRYMTRYCVHGDWNSTTRSCDCIDFTSGERCNRYIEDCSDLITPDIDFGDHIALIDPDEDGQNPLRVVCRTRSPNHWSILMLRSEGTLNFNRSWEEYKIGFYEDYYNLWAGLEVWHLLSVAGCTSMTTVVTFDASPITRLIRTHNDFFVGDESTGYAFRFSGSTPSTRGTPPIGSYYGDCLNPRQNVQFSTLDNDNDGEGSVNCASWAGSGWWYTGCNNPCNLLGYGFDHWFTKPTQELFSVEGLDMDAHASTIAYLTMYVKCS